MCVIKQIRNRLILINEFLIVCEKNIIRSSINYCKTNGNFKLKFKLIIIWIKFAGNVLENIIVLLIERFGNFAYNKKNVICMKIIVLKIFVYKLNIIRLKNNINSASPLFFLKFFFFLNYLHSFLNSVVFFVTGKNVTGRNREGENDKNV